ncbi:DUF1963 domain-containing protein [Motiliproteus coralliicola]|uniref:DUF1963 domain-containing protein n=1 Tax=Motiliproteus coralliicola TaxID=2283196 RepID=A0A369WLH5_9GAMM|nr:YwqG family protein [Motiliproteus coralliicola]RDE22497.1 DUF1963 domain-containing protein [Motiliproteus coralliicola]
MNSFILFVLVAITIFVLARILKPKPKTEEERALIEEGVLSIKEKLSEHVLESIKISPCSSPPANQFSSKFGGYPAWPSGRDYPRDKRDIPLKLLAQINLQELPENNILPSIGILQFFIADNSSWGLEFESKKRTIDQIIADSLGYRVVFHADIFEEVLDIENELGAIDYSGFPFEGECSLEFELEHVLCSPCDYRFEKIIGNLDNFDDDVIDAAFELVDSGDCRVGGYATFTQDDPRTLKPDEKWLLLFQMDSVSKNGFDIMWGDAGVANFFIQPEDLAKLDFSKIWFNWDCC